MPAGLRSLLLLAFSPSRRGARSQLRTARQLVRAISKPEAEALRSSPEANRVHDPHPNAPARKCRDQLAEPFPPTTSIWGWMADLVRAISRF